MCALRRLRCGLIFLLVASAIFFPACKQVSTPVPNAPPVTPVLTDITAGLRLVDEIDPAIQSPGYESKPGVSKVAEILGKKARVIPPGDEGAAISYLIGKNKGLAARKAYVLAVEYPDDVPRAIYLANRGSDYCRGWATGTAVGDVRYQFVEPSVESLNYPQTGQWQTYKQFFFLLERFQGVESVRGSKPGCRPYVPADGFNVVFFQTAKLNDPRSEGAALGRIKLYEVPDPKALVAPIHLPPDDLPRRRIFWREEMSALIVGAKEPQDRAMNDPVDWFVDKMRTARVLAMNTYTKDMLLFGFNQGWESGDENRVLHAQPPVRDLWTRLMPKAAEEGMDLLPTYEYKSNVGAAPDSLGRQRRAHKLYDGIKKTGGNATSYTTTQWIEQYDGDLTDPDTLADAKFMLDKTVLEFKSLGKFAGVWFRTRYTHLPVSFSAATIARFKADNPGDARAQTATQQVLIVSYEGDKQLYNQYIEWWLGRRAAFFAALHDYLAQGLGQSDVQVLFTPWPGDAVPVIHAKGQSYGHPGVVTDDPAWWTAYDGTLPAGYWKDHWKPSDFAMVVREGWYRDALSERPPINDPLNPEHQELFHSAPGGDPEHYKNLPGVEMTFPIGRLFTVADPALMEEYRSPSGLTVIQHTPLNEENENPEIKPALFGKYAGYTAVDCDRAGVHVMLGQARAIANGDPRNIGYLCGMSYSTGFPEIVRRFNQAFLAVPALPSRKLEGVTSDPEVVVREIPAGKHGVYYFVVNTSMNRKEKVAVHLPAHGTVTNLVTNETERGTELVLGLDSAELRAYRVGP